MSNLFWFVIVIVLGICAVIFVLSDYIKFYWYIFRLRYYAKRVGAGLPDPKALTKLMGADGEWGEFVEMYEANDVPGTLLDAGDVLYYLSKTYYSGLQSFSSCYVIFYDLTGYKLNGRIISGRDAYLAAKAKYKYRLKNKKNDAAERALIGYLTKKYQ